MTLRTRILTLVGVTALTLTIAVAAIAAGGPAGAFAAPGTATATAAEQHPMADFLTRLAANLGIGQDQLTAAIKQTNLQLIDEAAAAGRLTGDQAAAARDRVNNSPDGGPPFGIGGGRGGHGHGKGGVSLDAAASYFGVSADQLRQDLAARGSWQAVAAQYGKDDAAGKAGLKAALAGALRQSLTAKGIDAARIDQQVAQFEQNFDQFYTAPAGPRGPRGGQAPAPAAPAAPATSQ